MSRPAAARADERRAAPQPVECARCGATADVVKFSPQHTSVQWTAAAVRSCAEFRARAAEGTRSALVEGCSALRDSIESAVASGRLAVSPPAYERAESERAESERAESERAAAVRDFYQVTVAEVIRETGDASSFVLDVPPSLGAAFAYRPGQFVTVRVPSDRTGSVARCYSLCSSPHAGEPPAITVKRTAGGYASHWLLDTVTAGTVLDVLPPAGTFCPESLDGDFLLFAAGSGITPVISIVKSVLAAGRGRIALVYANRDERSVIFSGELRGLAAAAAGRLVVLHWLDSLQGTPAADAIAALARPYAGWEPYVCGPDPYLAVVRSALGRLGVPAKRVRAERFLSLAENPFAETLAGSDAEDGPAATLSVELDGVTRALPWPPGTRMLDVLIAAGLAAPYSCRQGICGACACQLVAGQVEMAHNEVLEAADLADGYILACQSVPLTPEVRVTY